MNVSHDDIVRATAEVFRLAARTLDGGPLPTDADMGHARTLIADKALRQVPLKVMMTVVEAAIDGLRRNVLSQAGEEDAAGIHEINDRLFAFAQRIHTMVTVSYVHATPQDVSDDDPHPVATGLLTGRDPDEVAHRHGVVIDAHYVVLRCATVPVDPGGTTQRPPHQAASGVRRLGARRTAPPHAAVKARADLAEVQNRLTAHFGSGTFTAPQSHPGLILIPGTPEWETLRATLADMGEDLGTRIIAVADAVSSGQVPVTAEHTRDLARIVARLRYTAGLYTFTDLALEYQLTRPGPGRDRLVEQLRALRDNEGLAETLEIHLSNNLDRRRTASALGLHPNTVDHRLKRITQLTGHNPARTDGLRQLHAASVVNRYLRAPLPQAAYVESATARSTTAR